MFLHGFVFLHSKTLQTNDVQISIKKYVRHHYFGILRQCSLPKNSLYKLATLNDLNVFKPLNTNHDSGHAKENSPTVPQEQKAQTLPQAGGNKVCY